MELWVFPVAQMVEHGASKRQDHGFDSQGKQELIKCKTVTWMQCKSLWIKASAKCINVNVMSREAIYSIPEINLKLKHIIHEKNSHSEF